MGQWTSMRHCICPQGPWSSSGLPTQIAWAFASHTPAWSALPIFAQYLSGCRPTRSSCLSWNVWCAF
eukprot:12929683-Prorocentrum_lima.AAC.1